MRIVSHRKLKDFYETKGREDSRVALERRYHIALKAEWKSLSDVKADFLQLYKITEYGKDYKRTV
jgi:mRNA interferase HigB